MHIASGNRFLAIGVLLLASLMAMGTAWGQMGSDDDTRSTTERLARAERLYQVGLDLYESEHEEDQKAGVEMIEEAEQLGLPDAYAWHGQFMHMAGRGLNNQKYRDHGLADMQKAVEMGSVMGQLHLGVTYAMFENRVEEGERLLIAAAEAGLEEAQVKLAAGYEVGAFGPGKEADAVRWIRVMAENGRAESQFWMGLAYFRGWGIKPDLALTERWMLAATENSFEDAIVFIGLHYATGKYYAKDVSKALDILEAGIEKNMVWAMQTYGAVLLHKDISDPPIDTVLGLAWSEAALRREGLSADKRAAAETLLNTNKPKLTGPQLERFNLLTELESPPFVDRSLIPETERR